MIEIEQKYRVAEADSLVSRLTGLEAVEASNQTHRDTYFNHPCRDFADTREALRVRRVDGVPLVTYKGSLLPGEVKARRELEWRLDPGDSDGSQMESLLQLLGFRRVATIQKYRRSFTLPAPWADFSVVLDEVPALGQFAEVELLVQDQADVEAARARIREFAKRLGLEDGESRSYLTMCLEAGLAADGDWDQTGVN